MNGDNDGGPAFPIDESQHTEQVEDGCNNFTVWTMGMSMRDYFAAKAMQGLIAKGMDNSNNRNAKGVPIIAGFAYEYADAMLKERTK